MSQLPPYLVKSDAVSTAFSGMNAQRVRMNAIASNMANVHTTRRADGSFLPYLRKEVLFKTADIKESSPDEQGVLVDQILDAQSPLRQIYDPLHPEADAKGYRMEPQVSIAKEMVSMIEASRAYEANLSGMKTASRALKQTTDILDKTEA
jgi:flagellar basal-body rod protein FlgC